MNSNPANQTAHRLSGRLQTINFRQYGMVLALLVIVLALSFANEYFLTVPNLTNVSRQIATNGILAIGMTFVILTGGIDLSVGSILALSGMVGASLVTGAAPHSALLGALAGVGCGLLLGALNGALVGYARLPAFVATLGMLSAARGLTLIYSDGMPISKLSADFVFWGQGTFAGVPVAALLFAAVVALAWFVLRFTVYGRWVYAVGGNPRSAFASGIPVRLVLLSVYAIMGALAGLSALILTARSTAALPQAGVAYELDAIAAVVIGGTSLTGGIGGVGATVIGVLIIGFLNNGLDLMGVSSYYQQVIKGVIIVLAVFIDRSRQQS